MNIGYSPNIPTLGREEKNSKDSIKFILFLPFSGTGYVMLAEHTELDEDVFLSPPEA